MALEYKKSESLRPYESIIIVHPTASEESKQKIFQKNKSVVESFGGKVHLVETWGKRKLINSINKLKTGEYFHSYFMSKPNAISEIERTLGINDDVLRVVHTRLEDKMSIEDHAKAYKDRLKESQERLNEAEARKQKRRDMREQRDQKFKK